MTITTLSSRQFSKDVDGALKAARSGPVVIADQGRPTHVLISIEQYQAPAGADINIVDLLAMPAAESIEFDAPTLRNVAFVARLD